jgi:hypothetical protein
VLKSPRSHAFVEPQRFLAAVPLHWLVGKAQQYFSINLEQSIWPTWSTSS